MKVLNSATTFREKYATRGDDAIELAMAGIKGGVTASGFVGTAAVAAGTAAAHASLWSSLAGWPLIGGLAASKATAVGVAAAMAGGAAAVIPAVVVGGGIAYAVYRRRKKKTLHKGSSVEELAKAFADVSWLPTLARAVSACRDKLASANDIQNFLLREMGAWGYSEAYIIRRFSEALKSVPAELEKQYERAIRRLASGSTEGIGATPAELPVETVREFADEFRRHLDLCFL